MTTATAYILSRIRALSPRQRAKWREKNDTLLRREAKRIVVAQWLAEISNPT